MAKMRRKKKLGAEDEAAEESRPWTRAAAHLPASP